MLEIETKTDRFKEVVTAHAVRPSGDCNYNTHNSRLPSNEIKILYLHGPRLTTLSTQNISYKTEDNNNKTTETNIKNLNSCRLVLPFYTKINNINYKRSHLSLLNLINAKKNGSREGGHQHTGDPV